MPNVDKVAPTKVTSDIGTLRFRFLFFPSHHMPPTCSKYECDRDRLVLMFELERELQQRHMR
jgi:hypothetical protein